jgi:putative ABC transport system permease protein
MRRPHDRDLDDEIRGHLALVIKDRIERGEDPEAARLAALREFGYIPEIRDSMRRVWYSRWFDATAALVQEMRVGLRSLLRSKGLTATVVVTLALGIGANAAIFSVVRGVLLRPLVNRDEDRLVYIRQSAPGIGQDNTTFSVPEINDLKARTTSLSAFGDFSVVEFIMTGLGLEPRTVRAGVVGGSFFEVMGLRPVLGRLISAEDDGQKAAGAVVLTHRFWTTALHSDPSVVGKAIRLGARTATVIGVLEPSVPYPAETEIIANMVTSPHHLGATMVTNRSHRMTELFARLAPGATLENARAELVAAHSAVMREHAEAYSARANIQLTVKRLRDQIVSPARTVLILLLASAALVFAIACSNVANLILARSVRREGELAVRAALGASSAALRRTLLAESLVLCGAGAVLGVILARPLVSVVARYASRFSVRALEVTVDDSLLWVGAGLAMTAAILLAYIPRLPSPHAPTGLGLTSGSVRITPGTNRRLRIFATTQIAFSFVLLAGAATLVASLLALQTAHTGYNLQQVVVFDVPAGAPGTATAIRYQEVARRIGELPGVRGVALGTAVPWRDAGLFQPFQFTVEGYTPADGEDNPHARMRYVAPTFFALLGVPLVAGRDFTADDRRANDDPRESVVIVSHTLAQRLFPNGEALNRNFLWTDPVLNMTQPQRPRRIVGVVADVDDENIVPGPAMTVYLPAYEFGGLTQRLFVHAAGDLQALVQVVTRTIRGVSPEQPVERPATLADVRAEVLAPERLNAFVLSGFAGVALLIAVVGVAGVLAFSVSARTRELGVRLAVGSTPSRLMGRVLLDGVSIVVIGITAGLIGGYAFVNVAASYVGTASLPGVRPLAGASAVLVAAAILASLMPAARAARVDVLQALKSD